MDIVILILFVIINRQNISTWGVFLPITYLGLDSPSSDHLENPRASSGCNGMQYSKRPLVDISLSNIQQTNNPLIARPLSAKTWHSSSRNHF